MESADTQIGRHGLLPIPVAERSKGEGLRPLACWDCGFEIRRGHGCLSVVSVVCATVKDKKAKGRTIQTKKRVWMKYKQSTREYKKNPAGGMDVLVVCRTIKVIRHKPGQSRQRRNK